jgi:purine-binding chemotaxis protein CheW
MTDATLTPLIAGRLSEIAGSTNDAHQYVSFWIGDQLLGVPVNVVQEVLKPQRITPTPLARPEIAGLLNLRGQIVTVINLRRRLALADRADGQPGMHVIVRHCGESYSLLVDDVGDVINVLDLPAAASSADRNSHWKSFSAGACQREDGLFVLLDVPALLTFE